MRHQSLLLLFVVVSCSTAGAQRVPYDRIPADVTGYGYADFDRFLSSHLLKDTDAGKDIAALITTMFGEHAEVTVYVPKAEEAAGAWVLLWHTRDAAVRKHLDARLAQDKTALVINYGQQEIHYSSMPPLADVAKRPAHPQVPAGNPGINLRLDLGSLTEQAKGPTYTAFVGEDLIVMAGDLPSITGAIDVVQGKRPSLAMKDPQGFKTELPPGVIYMGVGLTADYSAESLPKGNKAADLAANPKPKPDIGGLNLDAFGSFKGKAKLARFDMGEDDKQVFVDASVTMKDADSAEQVKNLVMGIKALITLSKASVKPLLDPLDIRLADKTAAFRWTWPVEKLPELYRLAEAQSGVVPATLPAK